MKHIRTIFAALIVWLGLISGESSYGQTADNPDGDLGGTNYGNMIHITWGPTAGASEYVIYRSQSISGPWAVLYTMAGETTKGKMIDVTPDAMTIDLCYQIDAKSSSGIVIYEYQPVCVPKYAP